MEPSRYKRMLAELSRNIRDGDLVAMKFMCSDLIPKARLEEVTNAFALWGALEERDAIGPNHDLGYLRQLLDDTSEGRTDLLNVFNNYCGRQDFAVSPHVRTPATATGPDLTVEINYLADNLGKNWRQFIRQLPGITEADIDSAMDHNPRDLQERIRSCLKIWLSRRPATASRATLVKACQACEMNLHAEALQEL